MLVDGENSGEVFIVPQDGYMGSTFKQLWISSSMYEPYVLAFLDTVSLSVSERSFKKRDPSLWTSPEKFVVLGDQT